MSQALAVDGLLKATPLFASLGDDDRRTIAGQMSEVRCVPGQLIFSRGDAGSDLYLVVEGRVRLSVLTAEGRELSFVHVEPGGIFGEIAAIDGGPRSADATAVTKSRLMSLGGARLKRLMQANTAVADAVMGLLCMRIRSADEQLEAIALHPIEVRLARFLLREARRAKDAKQPRKLVGVGLSQGELALLIGASRSKVNIALTALEDQGAIRRVDGGLECDPDELAAIAAEE